MPYTYKHGDRPIEGVTVQRAVGRGGFGEVYYALTDSGKQIALKYLRENPEIELRGISHVMNLKSPYLITIYDVKKNESGEPFVVMEYVSGPSLRDLLVAEPGGLGVQKASFFFCGIAKGLAYLHERGIVHRDLKPGNIFYDDGYVKIGDYGLSKHISVSGHSGQTVSVGTVHYMAPEIGSGSYSKAIDVYALGVMLYEMLSGKLPFTGSSMGEILMRHLSERPDTTGIPAPFADVIAKALAKDPNDRYADINEMVDAITSSAELNESMASFDPTLLSRVSRQESDEDLERTVTQVPPLPPVPSLDVRAPGVGDKVAERLEKRAEKFARKLEKKAAGWEKKLADKWNAAGAHAASPPAVPTPDAEARREIRRQRRAQIFVLAAVAIGAAVGMAVLTSSLYTGEITAALSFYIIGGTVGALLAYFRVIQRSLTRNTVMDRFAYAGIAAVCMVIGLGPADEVGGQLMRLMLAPVFVLFTCDWTKRIEEGRRGQVSVGSAFWSAVMGAIFAAIVGAEDFTLVAAGVCAMISLLTQAGAAMWPITGAAPQRPGHHKHRRHHVATAGIVAVDENPARNVELAAGEENVTPKFSPAASAVPPAPIIIDAAQPSFVGRTASAGLSFVGKILLLATITAAVLLNSLHVTDGSKGFETGLIINDFHVAVLDNGERKASADIPKAVVLAPLLLGSLLLMVARRHDGGAHFFRGFLGCLLAIVATLVAISPAQEGLRILLTENDWGALRADEKGGPLLGLAFLMATSLALLFWPKRPGPRHEVI
ncbi:MAG: serine/threonine protein kinase [Planctomycetes bacterium]|nr:serine/threonine protein kinase [Planctomycetota bacterium]